MAGRRSKRSSKSHGIKKIKKQDVRGVLSLLGRLANERGVASERHVCAMLKELLSEGKIADIIEVARHTWADFVLHTDIVVRRLDGTLVPIQVKSSISGIKSFIEKHTHSCLKQFGSLPVLIEAKPYGFENWNAAKHALTQQINRWQGYFVLAMWMLIPSPLFNLNQCRHLGHNIHARIRLFRKQYNHFIHDLIIPSS